MKHLKRWLALLVSAALALTLLAGCNTGGGIHSNLLLKLLTDQVENVSVETDSAFDRALKTAVRQGGSDPEAVLSALAEELGISAPLSFSISALSGGKAGQQSLDVVFQPGSDPDTAANNAASGWLPTLRGLGSSGKYSARVALAQVNGGYMLAIEVTVVQPGSSSEGSTPDTVVTGNGFSYNATQKEATVTTSDGLKELFTTNNNSALDEARSDGFAGVTITLTGSDPYTVDARLAETFQGKLQGESETSKASITLSGNKGLFGTLEGGTVENLKVTATSNINADTEYSGIGSAAGAVADVNKGAITGCEVNITNISSTSNSTGTGASAFVGGIAGYNDGGAITNCTVTVNGSITAERDTNNSANAGGIVGYNPNGTITGCTVTVKNSQSISATGNGSAALAGGIAGSNDGTIGTGCGVTLNDGSSITAETTGSNPGTAFAGGIVGQNNGTVECGPVTNAHATANYDDTSGFKYTATVSAGSGDTTASAPAIGTTHACASTTCGSDAYRQS